MQEQGITSDSMTTSLIAGRMVIGGITNFFVLSLSENNEGTFVHTEGWTKIAGKEHDFSNDSSLGGVPRKKGFEAVSSLMNKLESLNQKSEGGLPPNQLPAQSVIKSSTSSATERHIKYPNTVSSFRRMVTWLKRPKSMATLLSAVWIICIVAAIFMNPTVVSANDLSDGWVLGLYAAHPDTQMMLVDTISSIHYTPANPYNFFGITSDVSTISFESTETKGTFKALIISGDLTDSYKVGDKIIVRFSVNQFIAGMPARMTPLPTASVHHYSPIGTLNILPIVLSMALTILGIGFLLRTRGKTPKLPPPPTSPPPIGEQIPPPP